MNKKILIAGGMGIASNSMSMIVRNKTIINSGGRETGKTVASYSDMIVNGNWPDQVTANDRVSIKSKYMGGDTYGAIQDLQAILEQPIKHRDKTLL